MVKQDADFFSGTSSEDRVPVRRIVARDVSEAPDGLLFDLEAVRCVDDVYKDVDGVALDELEHVHRLPAGDVRQTPDGFELDLVGWPMLSDVQDHGDQVSVKHTCKRGLRLQGE